MLQVWHWSMIYARSWHEADVKDVHSEFCARTKNECSTQKFKSWGLVRPNSTQLLDFFHQVVALKFKGEVGRRESNRSC